MRVLVAPDSFKGSLTAQRVAGIIGDALRASDPACTLTLLPLGDGGEGTTAAVRDALRAADASLCINHSPALDARARPVMAEWIRLPDGTALTDAAACIGLAQLATGERDARRASSAGLGLLVRRICAELPTRVVIGLGGTATVDGGIGFVRAMGWRLVDAAGRDVAGDDVVDVVERVVRIEPPQDWPARWHRIPFTAWSDVAAPLCGSRGAARQFGPQKGAAPADVEALEHALARFADLVHRDVRDVDPDAPGMGAAGGLGFALRAFMNAEVVSGADGVLDMVAFDACVREADLVITGEGRLDAQTREGKLVSVVARRARAAGVPVVAVVGRLAGDARELCDSLALDDIIAVASDDIDDPTAILHAPDLLAAAMAGWRPIAYGRAASRRR